MTADSHVVVIGAGLSGLTAAAHLRARASSYVALGWQVGVLGAALLTPMLLPSIGWRGMFLVGVIPAIVAGDVRATVDRTFPLAEVAAAHRYLESNQNRGKVVLTVAAASTV